MAVFSKLKAVRGLVFTLFLFFATVGSLVVLNSNSHRCMERCKASCRVRHPSPGDDRRKCYNKCKVKCGYITLEDSG